MRTYKIALSHKMDDFNILGDKTKVEEQMFWNMLSDKVKLLTSDLPDKYEETLLKARECLESNKNKGLTIDGTWFSIIEKHHERQG